MENNTFSFQRFLLVLRKDIMENWKKNLLLLITGYGFFRSPLSGTPIYIMITSLLRRRHIICNSC